MTSLTAHRASPADIAILVHEHWGIESLRWLRDTVYCEDHSTARTGSGPRVMAALRNLAIGAIHVLGRRDITETTRWATRAMDPAVQDPAPHTNQRSWNDRGHDQRITVTSAVDLGSAAEHTTWRLAQVALLC